MNSTELLQTILSFNTLLEIQNLLVRKDSWLRILHGVCQRRTFSVGRACRPGAALSLILLPSSCVYTNGNSSKTALSTLGTSLNDREENNVQCECLQMQQTYRWFSFFDDYDPRNHFVQKTYFYAYKNYKISNLKIISWHAEENAKYKPLMNFSKKTIEITKRLFLWRLNNFFISLIVSCLHLPHQCHK